MARDGGGDGLWPPYGSSFFRLCCLNWFVMKIRPSWKSVSETMALAMPMPYENCIFWNGETPFLPTL